MELQPLSRKHLLVLPFPIFGHIVPFLELSRKLVKYHSVTFAISALKLDEVRDRQLISQTDETTIQFLPLSDGLTEDCDRDLHPKELADIIEKIGLFQRDLIGKIPIDYDGGKHSNLEVVHAVISDVCFPDPVMVCRERGIPAFMFACSAGWMVTGMLTVTEDSDICADEKYYKEDSPDPEPSYPAEVPSSLKNWLVNCNESIRQSTALVFNSFEDFEPDTKMELQHISRMKEIPMLFVGPIFASEKYVHEEDKIDKVMTWLGQQEDRSVLYVSFGSTDIASAEQILEIGYALLDSKKPFIWSLRGRQHELLPPIINQAIVRQFDTPDAPFLIVDWAPQKSVLGHPASRVFISHCGWNSVLETITCGVPIVAWPMLADQRFNAELVEQLGIGLMMPELSARGQRIVLRREIVKVVDLVAGWEHNEFEEGNLFYKSVKALSRKARTSITETGKSHYDFQKLVNFCLFTPVSKRKSLHVHYD